MLEKVEIVKGRAARRSHRGSFGPREALLAGIAAFGLSSEVHEARAQEGVEVPATKSVEISGSCRGAIDALMRLGFPHKSAVDMAKKMNLYRPNDTQESSILKFGDAFNLLSNGSVEVINQKGEKIAGLPKDGPVDTFTGEEGGWLHSTLCRRGKDTFCPPGAVLTPPPAKEVAPKPPVHGAAPEIPVPPPVLGPRVQVLRIAPCLLKDPCGPKAVYSEVIIFNDVREARAFLKQASETDPEFFTSYYQGELHGDERFIMTKNGKKL